MSHRMRIAVSVALALLAVVASAAYAGSVRDQAKRERAQALERYGGEVVELAVANRTVEAGETVSMADVEMRDWLASLAPEEAQTSVDEVVGKEVSVPIAKGVPFTDLNFRSASELAEIPSGHVAVSIPITEKLGVSSSIAAGTHAMAFKAVEGSAELIGSDALVLSAPVSTSFSNRGTLTIAVMSEDVAAILAASTSGDLRLVVPATDVWGLDGVKAGKVEAEPVGGTSAKPDAVAGEGESRSEESEANEGGER